MGLKMSNEQKLIETVLESYRDVHTGLNKDIECLIESGICDEGDLVDIKATVNKMSKLNRDIQDLLVAILGNDYDGKRVKQELLKLSTMRALQRDATDRKSMVEWFVKERLESSNG